VEHEGDGTVDRDVERVSAELERDA
jgi:hypothetical protein